MEQRKHPVHIVAAAGLVSRGDRVLLVRSPKRGWEFPGGQVEMGETVTQGVEREIYEESGIRARVTRFVGAYSSVSCMSSDGTPRPPVLNMDFLCEYISGEPRTSDESLEVGWFTRDEAREKVVLPTYVERLRNMLDFDGNIRICAFEKIVSDGKMSAKWIQDDIL